MDSAVASEASEAVGDGGPPDIRLNADELREEDGVRGLGDGGGDGVPLTCCTGIALASCGINRMRPDLPGDAFMPTRVRSEESEEGDSMFMMALTASAMTLCALAVSSSSPPPLPVEEVEASKPLPRPLPAPWAAVVLPAAPRLLRFSFSMAWRMGSSSIGMRRTIFGPAEEDLGVVPVGVTGDGDRSELPVLFRF